MVRRNKNIAALLLIAALALTGCAENQIPDLTEEQMQAVGEYVAKTLKKYDVGKRSRLMDLSAYEGHWENSAVQEPEKQETGMSPVDDTPVVNAPDAEQVVHTSYSMEEVLGLPEGCSLAFASHKLCSYYPEDDASLYFSLNASEGRKLLVLSFTMTNASSEKQSVNLLASDITYRITVNGDYTRKAWTTLLDNDLSVYSGELAAGEKTEVVLIIEVEDSIAENITSVSLSLKNGDRSSTSVLF